MAKSNLLRMDNVGIFVEDLKAMIAFFEEIGLELEGETTVEGRWVDRILDLEGVRCDIAMMKTPDGHGRIELSKFQKPTAIKSKVPLNTLGRHRLMFAVSDISELIGRLHPHGAKIVGEVVRYEDAYLLCYVRGPEDLIVALAQPLS